MCIRDRYQGFTVFGNFIIGQQVMGTIKCADDLVVPMKYNETLLSMMEKLVKTGKTMKWKSTQRIQK